jgi:hypothetical protein
MDIKRGGSPDSNLKFYDQVVRVEKRVGRARVCALYSLLHCHMKQGCQMSKYPTGFYGIYYVKAYA